MGAGTLMCGQPSVSGGRNSTRKKSGKGRPPPRRKSTAARKAGVVQHIARRLLHSRKAAFQIRRENGETRAKETVRAGRRGRVCSQNEAEHVGGAGQTTTKTLPSRKESEGERGSQKQENPIWRKERKRPEMTEGWEGEGHENCIERGMDTSGNFGSEGETNGREIYRGWRPHKIQGQNKNLNVWWI